MLTFDIKDTCKHEYVCVLQFLINIINNISDIKSIIILINEVFVISRIIKVEIYVISCLTLPDSTESLSSEEPPSYYNCHFDIHVDNNSDNLFLL